MIRNTSIVISDLWGSALADSNKMRTAQFLREQPEMFLGADFLQSHRVLVALSQRRLYLIWAAMYFARNPGQGQARSSTVDAMTLRH